MVDTFLFLFVFSGQSWILFLWLQNMLGVSSASHFLKLSRKEPLSLQVIFISYIYTEHQTKLITSSERHSIKSTASKSVMLRHR